MYWKLLPSWCFSHYSVPIHWLVHGHMFNAKCHEQSTLWKLWRQTGNCSLLSSKCWLSLHMIRACSCRWNLSALFTGLNHLLCYIINQLTTGPLGNREFCFIPVSKFLEMKSRETLRLVGKKWLFPSPTSRMFSDWSEENVSQGIVYTNWPISARWATQMGH